MTNNMPKMPLVFVSELVIQAISSMDTMLLFLYETTGADLSISGFVIHFLALGEFGSAN
jgi:hypothetical protein